MSVAGHLLAQLFFYHKIIMICKCLVQQCSCKKNKKKQNKTKQPKKSFYFEGVKCATMSGFFTEVREKKWSRCASVTPATSQCRPCFAKPICPNQRICKFCLICYAAAWNHSGLQFGCKPCWGNLLWCDTSISRWRAPHPSDNLPH